MQIVGCPSTAEPIVEEHFAHTAAAIAKVQAELPKKLLTEHPTCHPGLSGRPENSVGCPRKKAESRAFQGIFERAEIAS
ncbi:MAG: hypothetical protein REJ50_18350 [Bordetella sp.]|nr:hypothetical protein [Bordetella sp.]